MGAVLRATYARRGIIVSRWYLQFNRYSNSARYRGTCFVCSGQRRLDVSKDSVDPFEGQLFGGLGTAAGVNLSMRASSRFDSGKAGERIGDDIGFACERRRREFADRQLSETDDAPKNDLIWFAVFGSGNSGNERSLAPCAASRFDGAVAANIGVVLLFRRLAPFRSSMT